MSSDKLIACATIHSETSDNIYYARIEPYTQNEMAMVLNQHILLTMDALGDPT